MVGVTAGLITDLLTRGLAQLFERNKIYQTNHLDELISATKGVSISHQDIISIEVFRQPKGFLKSLFLERPDHTISFTSKQGAEFKYQLAEASQSQLNNYFQERALDKLPIRYSEYDRSEAKRIFNEYYSKNKGTK
jgi:hypothetical protein